MPSELIPDCVARLLWDVDPLAIDLDRERDRDLVFERVMTRGTWDAMCWLRRRYDRTLIGEFVRRHGARRLTPRDLAYWALVAGLRVPVPRGGARPSWARS